MIVAGDSPNNPTKWFTYIFTISKDGSGNQIITKKVYNEQTELMPWRGRLPKAFFKNKQLT
jgi:hypothetical protein